MKREYPCVVVDLKKITHNTKTILNMCKESGIEVVGVSKVFCAKKPIVEAMLAGGLKIIGDSRIENLKNIRDLDCRKMLLRIPMGSHAEKVVKYSDVSLNSELETIRNISHAAEKLGKVHDIILMIDVGDLREGVLEKDALSTIEQITMLKNVNLIGIGTNLTCYGGIIPDEKNLGRLVKIKNQAERIFHIDLPIISGGNSSSLYMVINKSIPKSINELRIGEAIALGRETSFGENIKGCYSDCFTLLGEAVETKFKPSVPVGNVGMDAFGGKPEFEDRGIIKRVIVAMGRQDVNIAGLTPVDSMIDILGASSDHLILDATKSEKLYRLSDVIPFKMNYGCLLMAMTSPYVKKYYVKDCS